MLTDLTICRVQVMKRKQPNGSYNLIGYSFGATVAVEMALQLNAGGDNCSLVMLDGSHAYVKFFTSRYSSDLPTEADKQTAALSSFLETVASVEEAHVSLPFTASMRKQQGCIFTSALYACR